MENPSYTMGGSANWHSHLENYVEMSLKTQNRTTIKLSNPSPGHTQQENQT